MHWKQSFKSVLLITTLFMIVSLACSTSDLNFLATATPAIPTDTPEPTMTPEPLTPEKILSAGIEKINEQSTFRYRVSVTLNVSDQPPIKLGAVGSLEAPDRAYSIVTLPDNSVNETLAVGSEIYTRPLDGEWKIVPPDEMDATIEGLGIIKDIKDFLTSPINLVQVADDKANNIDCYTLEFDMDARTVMADWEAAAQTDFETATGKSKLWIGKGDLLIRQWRMELNYTVLGSPEVFVIEYTLYGFNEPVKIPQLTNP
jgi:hypothetical protein